MTLLLESSRRFDSSVPEPTKAGSLDHYPEMESAYLPNKHDVLVCLPPGYDRDHSRHYPVLYLQDGQNVFDDWPMSPFGVQWGIDTTARALIHAEVIEPLIIVAIGNAKGDRIDEYTPTHDEEKAAGGLAGRYGSMLVNEIKPFIDRMYRTRQGASNTALGGSSLGALLSLYLGMEHPGVFAKLAILSPSVWWDHRWILRRLGEQDTHRRSLRIWLDAGTEEHDRIVRGARILHRMLTRKGWQEGLNLKYLVAEGGRHHERSWAERSGLFLKFLFPAH